jgi:hypothetical protein
MVPINLIAARSPRLTFEEAVRMTRPVAKIEKYAIPDQKQVDSALLDGSIICHWINAGNAVT